MTLLHFLQISVYFVTTLCFILFLPAISCDTPSRERTAYNSRSSVVLHCRRLVYPDVLFCHLYLWMVFLLFLRRNQSTSFSSDHAYHLSIFSYRFLISGGRYLSMIWSASEWLDSISSSLARSDNLLRSFLKSFLFNLLQWVCPVQITKIIREVTRMMISLFLYPSQTSNPLFMRFTLWRFFLMACTPLNLLFLCLTLVPQFKQKISTMERFSPHLPQ